MRRVLVANRGEIARRVIRAAHGLGIEAVAVYSDADRHALHVAEADGAIRLPGLTAAETYLDANQLLDAARRTGCDAVHPGYGFLAESAPFADVLNRRVLRFLDESRRALQASASR